MAKIFTLYKQVGKETVFNYRTSPHGYVKIKSVLYASYMRDFHYICSEFSVHVISV